MEHWFSYKVVQVLGRVTGKSLQELFDKAVQDRVFSLSIREDSMLGGLLIGNNLSSNVQDLLNRLCPFPDFIPDVSKLVTAFNNARTPKGLARTPGLGWYTKTTCFEFHKLLLSTIIAYRNSLRIFKRYKKDPTCAQQVWESGYLLWRIADSRILRHHLKLLNVCQWLPYPARGLTPDPNKLLGYIVGKSHMANSKP